MIGPIGGEILAGVLLGAAGPGKNTGAAAPAQGNTPISRTRDELPAQNGAGGVPETGGMANGQSGMQGAGRTQKGRFDRNECKTCKNRTYQDGSNDPGVSFKSPTRLSADQSASAVMGHEMEHVNRNRAKAAFEGREVISQSVTLQNAICPECGRVYVAGGVTRTVTANKKPSPYDAGKSQQDEAGKNLNAVA